MCPLHLINFLTILPGIAYNGSKFLFAPKKKAKFVKIGNVSKTTSFSFLPLKIGANMLVNQNLWELVLSKNH